MTDSRFCDRELVTRGNLFNIFSVTERLQIGQRVPSVKRSQQWRIILTLLKRDGNIVKSFVIDSRFCDREIVPRTHCLTFCDTETQRVPSVIKRLQQ